MKKMNKRGMGYVMMVMLLTALSVAVAVQSSPGFDVDTFKDKLVWTHLEISDGSENSIDLMNGLESLVNGLGEAFYHIVKFVAQYSSENPSIPFKLLFVLFVFVIILPFILLVFKFIVIICILIRDWRQSRRDNEMRRLLRERVINN